MLRIKKLYISLQASDHQIETGVDTNSFKKHYSKLSSGLGRVQQLHTIKLKPNAQPFSLKTPRQVPLPLLDKVKNELLRMERIRVLKRVDEATEWC